MSKWILCPLGPFHPWPCAPNRDSVAVFAACGGPSSSAGIPIAEDFNGDHRTDTATLIPASVQCCDSPNLWLISRTDGGSTSVSWGDDRLGDVPVFGDFDGDGNGDGRTDIAVAREQGDNLHWHIAGSRYGFFEGVFGMPTDEIVPGDFDGDSHADPTVVRTEANGDLHWYIANTTSGFTDGLWGNANSGDLYAQADYDGDGRTDIAVWRPDSPAARYFILLSTGGVGTPEFGDGNTDFPFQFVQYLYMNT